MATISTEFTGRLNRLFEQCRQPNGQKWNARRLAQWLSERGTPVSATYLYQLRKGTKSQPSFEILERLAECFGVDPAYFLAEDPDTIRLPTADDRLLREVTTEPHLRQVILMCARTLVRGRPDDVVAIQSVLRALDQTVREEEREDAESDDVPPITEKQTPPSTDLSRAEV